MMNWIRDSREERHFARVLGLVCFLAMIMMALPVWAQDDDDVDEEAAAEDGAEQEEEEEEEAAPAGPTPTIFLFPSDGLRGEVTELVTERINDSIRERMESLSGVELLPSFEAFVGAASGQDAQAAVAQAEMDYTSGIGLVNAGDYEDAVDRLRRAVTVLQENVATLSNFDVLTDAMANLAIAYYETGYDLDARQTIQQFAQLKPDADFDREEYPDGLISLFDNEIDRIEQAGNGIVHIEADREGAQVYINGESKGAAPLTVEDVGFGEHFMVVRDGDMEWVGKIRVRARGQEQTEEVELQHVDEDADDDDGLPSYYVDLRTNFRSGQFGREIDPYLQEVADQTGADYIGWTLVVRDGRNYAVTPFIYRMEDGMLMQGDDVHFNQQLSNMRSRANQLTDVVATSVVFMPDDAGIDEVDLIGEEEVVAEADPEEEVDEDEPEEEATPSEDEDDELAQAEDEEDRTDELPLPQAEAEEGISDPMRGQETDRSEMWRYVGWGGAAAVGVGAVATTIILLVRSSGSGDAVGFDAEVEW